ncbi:hypothetical protein [Serratia proteamaculans]|uniref:hypothetical protein n=1 Tax=Serratia proteamaculans TaxID=28151 RepID=UPI0010220074|nr:hypothetical protein [Serratia proteamaculans]RYM47701.1 hypothetical protein BSQ97_24390 [Serratia proteamaculans]
MLIKFGIASLLLICTSGYASEFVDTTLSDGVKVSVVCSKNIIDSKSVKLSPCIKIIDNDPDDGSPYVAVTFGTEDYRAVVKTIGKSFLIVYDRGDMQVHVDKIIPAYNGGMVAMYGNEISRNIRNSKYIYLVLASGARVSIKTGDPTINKSNRCKEEADRFMSSNDHFMYPDPSWAANSASIHSKYYLECLDR